MIEEIHADGNRPEAVSCKFYSKVTRKRSVMCARDRLNMLRIKMFLDFGSQRPSNHDTESNREVKNAFGLNERFGFGVSKVGALS